MSKPTIEALLENFREHRLMNLGLDGSSRESAYKAGHRDLAPLLVKLATCWKDIPLLDCTSAGFAERLHRDRDCRVRAFNNALKEIEAALAQGTEARGEVEKR